jgi:hypothetical protein
MTKIKAEIVSQRGEVKKTLFVEVSKEELANVKTALQLEDTDVIVLHVKSEPYKVKTAQTAQTEQEVVQ